MRSSSRFFSSLFLHISASSAMMESKLALGLFSVVAEEDAGEIVVQVFRETSSAGVVSLLSFLADSEDSFGSGVSWGSSDVVTIVASSSLGIGVRVSAISVI
jgi:hypothetical protein